MSNILEVHQRAKNIKFERTWMASEGSLLKNSIEHLSNYS
jgi:hypothetical protein